MSIIWINEIILETVEDKVRLRETSIFLLMNILSVLLSISFIYLYKSHSQLHRPPSKHYLTSRKHNNN